jgi:DNA-binding transcriptional ArsR family regulator
MMAAQTLDVFQVIADPSRRQMMHLLSRDSMTINALAKNFDMSRPAVSKHIKIMYNAGFISITDIGRERYCTLKQDGFNELQNFISCFDKFWATKLKKLETILNTKARSNEKPKL